MSIGITENGRPDLRAVWPGLPDWPEQRDNHRGAFAYVEAELADGEEIQLMRLLCDDR
ncbi:MULTISPECIES: hypothetical protein [unclassified Streptomyces]|uniref:hypothetical protein n=1 Tax=unclassified Streptomyces TaxID=2593676 RepID=UPI002F913905